MSEVFLSLPHRWQYTVIKLPSGYCAVAVER